MSFSAKKGSGFDVSLYGRDMWDEARNSMTRLHTANCEPSRDLLRCSGAVLQVLRYY